MKKLFAVAAIAVALTLAGCSAAPAGKVTAETSSSAPVASKTSATPAPVLTATATPVNDEFLAATRRIPGLENVKDDDALKTGHYVCSQLDAGVSPLKITAVQNTAEVNNEDMIMVSTLTLCKNHNDSVQKIFQAEHVKQAQSQG